MQQEQKVGIYPECRFSVSVYERVQSYADEIRNDEVFKNTLNAFKSEGKHSLKRMLIRGVHGSILALETMKDVSDPSIRLPYSKQLDNEEIPESWVENIILGRNQSDVINEVFHEAEVTILPATHPDRIIETLEQIKEKDMDSIMRKTNKVMDMFQVQSYRRHAEVLGMGHDFVINRLRYELAIECGVVPDELFSGNT